MAQGPSLRSPQDNDFQRWTGQGPREYPGIADAIQRGPLGIMDPRMVPGSRIL